MVWKVLISRKTKPPTNYIYIYSLTKFFVDQIWKWDTCYWIVHDQGAKVVTWPETFHFGIYWARLVVLCFDPSTRPKNAIPRWCTGRKWHIPMASNRKRSRGRIKAYNMGQGEGPTVSLQWCTRREWPVNCMTVISAWWRLNIRFQRSSERSCGRWIII